MVKPDQYTTTAIRMYVTIGYADHRPHGRNKQPGNGDHYLTRYFHSSTRRCCDIKLSRISRVVCKQAKAISAASILPACLPGR